MAFPTGWTNIATLWFYKAVAGAAAAGWAHAGADAGTVPIVVTQADLPAGFWALLQSNMLDLRVTTTASPSGTGDLIPCEVGVNGLGVTSGATELWIGVPTAVVQGLIAAGGNADQPLYLWGIGSGGSDTGQGAAVSVWATGYQAVWHFGTSSVLSLADSSSNVASGNITNHSVAAGTGLIGGAANCGSGAGYFTAIQAAAFAGTDVQLECWAKFSSLPAGYANEIAERDLDATTWGIQLLTNGSNVYAGTAYSTTGGVTITSATSLNTTGWHSLVELVDGSYLRLFIDGTEDANSPKSWSGTMRGSGGQLTVGATDGAGRKFNGLIDELRFGKNRSAAWNAFQKANVAHIGDGTFLAVALVSAPLSNPAALLLAM